MNSSSAQSVISGVHGRQRREERNIPKADGKLARRYGMKESAGNGLFKYTYKGYVFIISPSTNKEVTSYIAKDWASPFSGTRLTEPLFVPMKKVLALAPATKQEQLVQYSTHTIFLIGLSSIMRQDDMDGARCRSDGIFYSIATGFVESINKSNDSAKENHIASVILLHDSQATTHISMKPVDELLFNQLIDLREWSTCRPNGDTVYVVALQAALELMKKSHDGCRMNLCIIASDDTPLIYDNDASTS
jgi:hypothetical protein